MVRVAALGCVMLAHTSCRVCRPCKPHQRTYSFGVVYASISSCILASSTRHALGAAGLIVTVTLVNEKTRTARFHPGATSLRSGAIILTPEVGRGAGEAAALGTHGRMPPAASEVEVLGFAAAIATRTLYVAYLLWLFVPDATLHQLGITYYPDKHWAVAGPAWITLALVWGYWMYEGLNMSQVPRCYERVTIQDAKCKLPSSLGIQGYGHGTKNSIPPLCHIPPEVVSEVLFGSFMAEGANHGTHRRR